MKKLIHGKTIGTIATAIITLAILATGCGDSSVNSGGESKYLNMFLDVFSKNPGHTLTVSVPLVDGRVGGTVLRSSNNKSYKTGDQVTVTAKAMDGYIFTGWTGASNDTTASVTIIMDRDTTLTAHFIPEDIILHTLNVNLEPSAGGNVSREPNRTVYNAGEQVAVTATAATGYTFTGWSGDANGANASITVTMDRNLTVNANFQQNTYSLSIGANPTVGGTVSRDPQKASYTYGELVTVTAVEASGYTFKGWADSAAPANPSVTVIIDGNKTLTAIFEQQKYTLTTNVSPSGYGSILRDPNKETYAYGEKVTVTATETSPDGDNYYAFNGWTGALESKSAGVTITMDGNKTLTANFTRGTVPYYTLTTITNPDVGTISRNPNNASYRENQTVTVTAPTAPAVTGYTFTGWSGDTTGTTNPVTVTMNKSKTLTANYRQLDYTLTIIIDPTIGGQVSRTPYKNTYTYNDKVTVSAEEKPGYKFTRWSGASTSTSPNIEITMDGNKELTAYFEPSTYTLDAVVANPTSGGDVSRYPNKDAYNYNDQVTVTATAKSCYTFTGWSGAATGTTNPVTITMNDSKKLTANFQLSQNTLTTNISPSGGGTVSRSLDQTGYTCETTVSVTATPASGYTFTGWSGAATGTANPVTITIDDNKTLTANFKLKEYTLTTNVSPSGGGTVSRSTNQTYYDHGTTVAVTATAASCYTFIGWSGASTSTSPSVTITMDGNKELTANFQQNQYTISASVSPSGGGTVLRSPDQTNYACGTTVTLTATAASCYTFTGWSGAATGTTNPLTVTVDGNKELIATFQQKQCSLLIKTNGGSVTRTPDKEKYDCGEQVTVTAIPTSTSNSFKGWSGALISTNPIVTITMDGNKELVANFQDQYTLTTDVSPYGGGSISRSPNPDQRYYDHGEQVTVTATAASCYKFTGWSGASTSTNRSVTITMDGNKELTANFQQNQYTVTTSVSGASPSSSYGSVSRSPSQTNYACGTSVTLTAMSTNSDTVKFDSWSGAPYGAIASGNQITFTINSDVAITAKFKVKRSDTPKEFPPGSHTYKFDKGFPATVEVYAVGAGGGGAGGSSNVESYTWYCITGGGGGSGAAVHARLFDIENGTSFSVTVGKSGKGGDPKKSPESHVLKDGWNYGYDGDSGTSSTVKIDGVTITAEGGKGGKGGSSSSGGGGGSGGEVKAEPKSVIISNISGNSGERGRYGDRCAYGWDGISGVGGRRVSLGVVNGKTIYSGKGGDGGWDANLNNGFASEPGENGQVIIIFTWWE